MNIPAMRPFIHDPTRSIYRFSTSKEYRRYIRLLFQLGNLPRYSECSTRVNDWSLVIPDNASFLSSYKEIFVENIYDFPCASAQPYIVDLGANIGLSVLFFKKVFPKAEVCALEADPTICRYLVRNVHENGYDDVTIINKAAWHEDSVLKFSKEGADGGRVAIGRGSGTIDIEAMDVSRLLVGRQVDFLKMDIEGAEVDVLLRCSNHLDNVKRVFVEFHSEEKSNQRLAALLEVLEEKGFRYHIHSAHQTRRPFMGRATLAGYDMLLNIFAWRENP